MTLIRSISMMLLVVLLAACEPMLAAVGVTYYYSTVPENPEPPESVFVKPDYQPVKTEYVADPLGEDRNLENAFRGRPGYYRQIPTDSTTDAEMQQSNVGATVSTTNGANGVSSKREVVVPTAANSMEQQDGATGPGGLSVENQTGEAVLPVEGDGSSKVVECDAAAEGDEAAIGAGCAEWSNGSIDDVMSKAPRPVRLLFEDIRSLAR